jgi:DNA topoisomerase-1
VLAACALRDLEPYDSEAQAKRNIVEAVAQVAKKLGNTKAVSRKCYIHPAVLEAYLDGGVTITDVVRRHGRVLRRFTGLSREEIALLALLERRGSLSAPRRASDRRVA